MTHRPALQDFGISIISTYFKLSPCNLPFLHDLCLRVAVTSLRNPARRCMTSFVITGRHDPMPRRHHGVKMGCLQIVGWASQ